jgi:vanillate O-demethylase monooxygenase subunit
MGVPQEYKLESYFNVGSNYELVTDNLLDLSHVEFLHPTLTATGYALTLRYKAMQEDNNVTAYP